MVAVEKVYKHEFYVSEKLSAVIARISVTGERAGDCAGLSVGYRGLQGPSSWTFGMNYSVEGEWELLKRQASENG